MSTPAKLLLPQEQESTFPAKVRGRVGCSRALPLKRPCYHRHQYVTVPIWHLVYHIWAGKLLGNFCAPEVVAKLS